MKREPLNPQVIPSRIAQQKNRIYRAKKRFEAIQQDANEKIEMLKNQLPEEQDNK